MSERQELEQQLIVLDEWFSAMDKTQHVDRVDHELLNQVLNHFGAEMEVTLEEEESLAKYSNKASRDGMNGVWGQEKYDDFVSFCREWIEDYETKTGNELPKLGQMGRKNAGMKEFFHQVISFAYGSLTLEEFTFYTEVRLKNGKLWQEGRKDERERVTTPISGGEKKLIGSLPPGFVTSFWGWLKSNKENK